MLRHPYTPPVEALHLQLSSDSSPYLAHTLLLWMRDQLEARRLGSREPSEENTKGIPSRAYSWIVWDSGVGGECVSQSA